MEQETWMRLHPRRSLSSSVPKFQIEGRINESFWALRPVISAIHVDRGANSLTFHQTYEAQHVL